MQSAQEKSPQAKDLISAIKEGQAFDVAAFLALTIDDFNCNAAMIKSITAPQAQLIVKDLDAEQLAGLKWKLSTLADFGATAEFPLYNTVQIKLQTLAATASTQTATRGCFAGEMGGAPATGKKEHAPEADSTSPSF